MKLQFNSKVVITLIMIAYSLFLIALYDVDKKGKLEAKSELFKVIGIVLNSNDDVAKRIVNSVVGQNIDLKISEYKEQPKETELNKIVIDSSQNTISITTGKEGRYLFIKGRFDNIMESTDYYLLVITFISFFCIAITILLSIILYQKIYHLNKKLKEKNYNLEIIAVRDALTNCFNRHHFRQYQEEYYNAFLSGEKVTVCLIDIDYFKDVNDQFGHDVGDIVLQKFSWAISSLMPVDNSGLYRFGGEEFIAVFIGMNHGEVSDWVESLFRYLKQNPIKEINRCIECSIGFSNIVKYDNDILNAVKRADKALYNAKRNGRNQYFWLDGNNN